MIVGDTPTIRLDQQGGGWSPQIWDVAGNEANFFIRDVTNGSKLPFRIKPGAPTDSLIIRENGFVGIGTYNPEAELHVAGDAVLEGYLSERSDMFAKENFKMVNGSEVLERLSEIPISVWNYKDDENKTEHMGPMAQDFYAAFGLGKDDTHIAALDVNGVVLASIQELSKTITEKETEIQVLNDKVNSLETRLEKLESAQSPAAAVNLVLPLIFGIAGLTGGAWVIKNEAKILFISKKSSTLFYRAAFLLCSCRTRCLNILSAWWEYGAYDCIFVFIRKINLAS